MNLSVILNKAVQRTNYNAGRVLREMGLSKLKILMSLSYIYVI